MKTVRRPPPPRTDYDIERDITDAHAALVRERALADLMIEGLAEHDKRIAQYKRQIRDLVNERRVLWGWKPLP